MLPKKISKLQEFGCSCNQLLLIEETFYIFYLLNGQIIDLFGDLIRHSLTIPLIIDTGFSWLP